MAKMNTRDYPITLKEKYICSSIKSTNDYRRVVNRHVISKLRIQNIWLS